MNEEVKRKMRIRGGDEVEMRIRGKDETRWECDECGRKRRRNCGSGSSTLMLPRIRVNTIFKEASSSLLQTASLHGLYQHLHQQ